MEQNSKLDGLSCQEIFALLSQYLDAELPPDLCEKLSGHIEGCAPCVEFVDSLRQSIAMCRDLRLEQMPGPLAEEVRNKMRQAYEGMES
jgi:RNA polymerase sigma-70 factor (ECF subfamily)